MKVLEQQSTLETDLLERIRKKLQLTEIIVLEEPPLERPVLDDEMIDVIEHAVI